MFSVIDLQKKWKSIKDAYKRDKGKNNNCSSGSGAKPRRPYIYSNLLTFLDPLYEIRSPSQNDDAALGHDKDCDFQKPHSPKKSKKTPKHEDPQDKLYEALTANLKESKANNTILSENPDILFLVSLAKDFSAIKEEFKLEAKADMINLIRKYKNMGQSSRTLHENRYQGAFQYEHQYGYQSGYQSEFQPQYPSNQSAPRNESVSSLQNLDSNESVTNDSDIISDMYDDIE